MIEIDVETQAVFALIGDPQRLDGLIARNNRYFINILDELSILFFHAVPAIGNDSRKSKAQALVVHLTKDFAEIGTIPSNDVRTE